VDVRRAGKPLCLKKGEAAFATSAQMTEKEAITRAVQRYIDGAMSGSSAVMRRAFHEGATIFVPKRATVCSQYTHPTALWHDQNGPAANLKAQPA
jgi:hypothetical protein